MWLVLLSYDHIRISPSSQQGRVLQRQISDLCKISACLTTYNAHFTASSSCFTASCAHLIVCSGHPIASSAFSNSLSSSVPLTVDFLLVL
ncbi:hypothetical protein ANANG_G00194110 [Anguilla anguilla]|uniref:Uncharacterized protein n=1 Tax=Anguilla anguilla TaxID=7936 RepID=A0A9D3RS80_ANGAN|nr:hypothetical protein ANANG_G00194110 [Anguilla anguilla]